MSSGGGGGGCVCQSSNCSNSNEDDVNGDSEVHTQHRSFANFPINGGNRTSLCSKCGQAEQVYRGTCVECLRSYVFGKFKLAVTSNAMIAPMDKVLIAFSGGRASRVKAIPCLQICSMLMQGGMFQLYFLFATVLLRS